jgi:16S rRNA (guanine966-N2)-methyltransferase
VLKSDVIRGLEALAAADESFDLVLLDPPYRKGWGDKVLPRLMELNLLTDGGWVATEVSRLEAAPASLMGLERVSLATLGDHQIALYQRQSREDAL